MKSGQPSMTSVRNSLGSWICFAPGRGSELLRRDSDRMVQCVAIETGYSTRLRGSRDSDATRTRHETGAWRDWVAQRAGGRACKGAGSKCSAGGRRQEAGGRQQPLQLYGGSVASTRQERSQGGGGGGGGSRMQAVRTHEHKAAAQAGCRR